MSAQTQTPYPPDARFLPPSAAAAVVNPVIARLTLRSVAAPRRAVPLVILAVLVLGLSGLVAWGQGRGLQVASDHLQALVLGVAVPLIGLIVGTAAVGPAIEDGSIIYFLAKPVSRGTVARSTVAACVGLALVIAVPLTTIASLIMAGSSADAGRFVAAFTLTAAVGTIAYTTLFALLSALTRNGVLFGLIYTLVWESTIGGYVQGATTISVRHWALSVGEAVLGKDLAFDVDVDAAVGPVLGGILLLVLVGGSLWLLARRLDGVRVGGDD